MIIPEIPENEAARLAVLARYEILDTIGEQEFDDITLLASQICQTPISLISFVDAERQWFKSRIGLDAVETSRDISFCGHAINGNNLFEVPNALEDSRFATNPLVAGAPNIRFYAGMPLITSDGYKLGTLCVIDQQPHQLTETQKQSLGALARQVIRQLEIRIYRKYSDTVLVTANTQLEAALEAIPDLIWVKDAQGVFVKCNHTFARYMGMSQSEILGKTEYDFFSKEVADFYRLHDQKVMAEQNPITMEAWLDFADGYRGLFEAVKTPVLDTGGKVIGTLSMAHDITHRKRNEAKVRRKQEAMQTLNEIASKIFHEDFKEQLRAAVALGASYLGLETGLVCAFNNKKLKVETSVSTKDWIFDGAEFALKNTCTYRLLSKTNEYEVVAITDFESQTDLLNYADSSEQASFIGILILINKEVYGALSYFSSSKRLNHFEASEIEFVRLLSAWISSAIQREQLAEALRNSNERIELALEGADLGLWDWHIPSNKVTLNERWYEMLGYAFEEIPPSLHTYESLLHPDECTSVLASVQSHLRGETAHLDIEFRMRHKHGQWVWIDSHGRVIERDKKGLPVRVIGTHMDITHRKSTEEEIKHLAFYDVLTGLPNRRLLLDRLAHAMASSVRTGGHGALLFIDLDNFKTINDTLGHDEGDKLLSEVAIRLIGCVRVSDTVARLGGDEFVIMLESLDKNIEQAFKQIEVVGEKILTALNMPYKLTTQDFHNTPSIGVTLFTGHQDSLDELLKRADMAMYQAKAAGRNCLRFFNPAMQAAVSAFAALEADLRYSLDSNQFILYYQPQIDSSGKLMGAEALLRWKHPLRGMVSPAEFIPVAEQTGLILPIGLWVLEAGCKQLVDWARHDRTAHIQLSINVSARQFRQPSFVTQVCEVINKTGANPRMLKLELTESMLVEDVEDVISKMNTLQAIGVSFSLDDFGTGFSSLSYLKRLPLNQLKIDQSFVRDVLTDPNDAVIVCSIVALARSLGFNVIAEGVETEAQRDFLAENDCHEYQGYLFSRPLPIKEFNAYSKSLPLPKLTLIHSSHAKSA